jgi:hypothetical protein
VLISPGPPADEKLMSGRVSVCSKWITLPNYWGRSGSSLSRKTMLNNELLICSSPLYSMRLNFLNLLEKLTRGRVVPTLSANVSRPILVANCEAR